MTNEEWDKKAEFLLNRQAQFDVDMEELKKAQRETEKFLRQTAEMISSGTNVMFESFKITDAKIRELTESQKVTDQAIRNLNAKVDRHIDEGHSSA